MLTKLKARIFFISFLLLFLELVLIRYLPAQIAYLGYYSNFILLASFVGIGGGILFARSQWDGIWIFPWALLALFALSSIFTVSIIPSSSGEIHFSSNFLGATAPEIALVPTLFMVVALTMALLAQRLGRLLNSLPPLTAYTFDILGSLAGIAIFTLCAYWHAQPTVWISVFAIVFLALTAERTRRWLGAAVAFALIIFVLSLTAHTNTFWSPYQKVTVEVAPAGAPGRQPGFIISVNNVWHQTVVEDVKQKEWFYFFPYQAVANPRFQRALVIGAGTGNDVAVALQQGVEHIDAVEIDPEILRLGKDLHPNQPYSDARVNTYVADARSFLEKSDKIYDLIIFALPDSLVMAAAHGNIRLESFLFTQESFAAARARLAPNGLIALYNYYRQPWLIDRLAAMLDSAFGRPTYVFRQGDNAQAVLLNGGKLTDLKVPFQPAPPTSVTPRLASDDWPFLYLARPSLPWRYLLMLGVIAALVYCSLYLKRPLYRVIDPPYFFLGAAFLLLETKSIIQFTLLFGATWLVNALVFFAVLCSVLFATLTVARLNIKNFKPWYVALAAALVVQYLFSLSWLLAFSPVVKYILVSALIFTPIFLANIIFSCLFKQTRDSAVSFASNILGAAFGGIAEYAAMLVGYRQLILVVMACYFLAFFFVVNWRRR